MRQVDYAAWLWHRSLALLLAGIVICSLQLSHPAHCEEPSTIKSDERVVFFPTVGQLGSDRKHWEAVVHGWIFEPERDDLLRAAAIEETRETLGLDPDEPATKTFTERIRLFLVDNERGKRVGIRLAGETYVMGESAADGHFTGTVRVKIEAVAEPLRKHGALRFEAILPVGDGRRFEGAIYCLADEGTSVISDIDDTIKVSNVQDKAELLQNTFFRDFIAVNGMAAAYDKWATAGADFHYVSAAPWQLYEPLESFLVDNKFPLGTVQLKRIRLKDETFFKLFEDPVKYKLAIIKPLVAQFPNRKFVLVGDSGEKDPEAYGAIARRFPKQIERIWIRNVTGEKPDAVRYKRAFDGVRAEKWQVFDESRELQ